MWEALASLSNHPSLSLRPPPDMYARYLYGNARGNKDYEPKNEKNRAGERGGGGNGGMTTCGVCCRVHCHLLVRHCLHRVSPRSVQRVMQVRL